ncbi:unnamed protein product [Brachionus calyciflorus]|uniref:Uncharacterized protein n=1 Tax=Brachionus calyciflorus TaxID=104777 RepID=A0A814QAQ0_9BILA|nr:unnamed protein product [Brachionus calyciflorus]
MKRGCITTHLDRTLNEIVKKEHDSQRSLAAMNDTHTDKGKESNVFSPKESTPKEKPHHALETPQPQEELFHGTSHFKSGLNNVTWDSMLSNDDKLEESSILENKELKSSTMLQNNENLNMSRTDINEMWSHQRRNDTVQHFCSPCVDAIYNNKHNQTVVHKESSFKPERFTKSTDVD